MQRLLYCICFAVLCLFGCQTAVEDVFQAGASINRNAYAGNYRPDIINVQPLEARLLCNTNDPEEDAEMQVFVLIKPSRGETYVMGFPSTGGGQDYFSVPVGESVRLGQYMPGIDRSASGDSISVEFLVVDNDEFSDFANTSIGTLISSFQAAGSLTGFVSLGLDALDMVSQWYQQSDTLGYHETTLDDGNGWRVEGPIRVQEGCIELTFQVEGTSIRATPLPPSQLQFVGNPATTSGGASRAVTDLLGRIVFAVTDPFARQTQLVFIQSGSSQAVTFADFSEIRRPVFSPEGTRVAFTAKPPTMINPQIYVTDLTVTTPVLADIRIQQDDAVWLNANEVAYTARGDDVQIMQLMNILQPQIPVTFWTGGANEMRVWNGDIAYPDVFGVDLAYLVCTQASDCSLEVRLNEGGIQRLMTTDNVPMRWLDWSPAGGTLLVVIARGDRQVLTGVDMATLQPFSLVEMREILYPRWSPDGLGVLFVGDYGSGRRLLHWSADGGVLTDIAPTGFTVEQINGIDWMGS